jgi:hypothetical protein
MTTFTTEDRILAEKDGSLTVNVEPIPFAGWISTSPPHIVDSGASVMNNEPVAWFIQAKIWHEFTFSKPAEDSEDVVITPLYTHPAKTLTDEEILQFRDKVPYSLGSDLIDFARAILRKAQEK